MVTVISLPASSWRGLTVVFVRGRWGVEEKGWRRCEGLLEEWFAAVRRQGVMGDRARHEGARKSRRSGGGGVWRCRRCCATVCVRRWGAGAMRLRRACSHVAAMVREAMGECDDVWVEGCTVALKGKATRPLHCTLVIRSSARDVRYASTSCVQYKVASRLLYTVCAARIAAGSCQVTRPHCLRETSTSDVV